MYRADLLTEATLYLERTRTTAKDRCRVDVRNLLYDHVLALAGKSLGCIPVPSLCWTEPFADPVERA